MLYHDSPTKYHQHIAHTVHVRECKPILHINPLPTNDIMLWWSLDLMHKQIVIYRGDFDTKCYTLALGFYCL